ncbi:MAG: hypothetical protein WA183_08205 [Chthoniobacterales bacterium]
MATLGPFFCVRDKALAFIIIAQSGRRFDECSQRRLLLQGFAQLAMLEDIPRHGPKLAEELRRVGAEIKEQVENELADL